MLPAPTVIAQRHVLRIFMCAAELPVHKPVATRAEPSPDLLTLPLPSLGIETLITVVSDQLSIDLSIHQNDTVRGGSVIDGASQLGACGMVSASSSHSVGASGSTTGSAQRTGRREYDCVTTGSMG
jgi:hypothetical protein